MADQEQVLAALAGSLRARVLSDEVSGAARDGLHGYPTGFEAEGFDARKHYVFHCFDACEIHRATVDVDDSLEKRLIFCDVGVNELNDPSQDTDPNLGSWQEFHDAIAKVQSLGVNVIRQQMLRIKQTN